MHVHIAAGSDGGSPDAARSNRRIWHELQQLVGARCPMSTEELIAVAHEEWGKLDQGLINRHVKHFASQIQSL